jgi:hypothetical protein
MTKLQTLKTEYHESKKYNHEFGGDNKKISEDYIKELEKVNREITGKLLYILKKEFETRRIFCKFPICIECRHEKTCPFLQIVKIIKKYTELPISELFK